MFCKSMERETDLYSYSVSDSCDQAMSRYQFIRGLALRVSESSRIGRPYMRQSFVYILAQYAELAWL